MFLGQWDNQNDNNYFIVGILTSNSSKFYLSKKWDYKQYIHTEHNVYSSEENSRTAENLTGSDFWGLYWEPAGSNFT